MSTTPQPPAEVVPEDHAALRRDAERYRWLRERAVRINGSIMWWSGVYLDVRVDTGLEHVQGEGEAAKASAPVRRVTRANPKLK